MKLAGPIILFFGGWSLASSLPYPPTRLGVLSVSSGDHGDRFEERICIRCFPSLFNVSKTENGASTFRLGQIDDLRDVNTCQGSSDLNEVRSKVALVSAADADETGNCSVADRAVLLEEFDSIGLIATPSVNFKFDSSEFQPTKHFVISLMKDRDEQRLVDLMTKFADGKFLVFSPETLGRSFDANSVIIFLMAVLTVAVGSFWSGHVEERMRKTRTDSNIEQMRSPENRATRSSSNQLGHQDTSPIRRSNAGNHGCQDASEDHRHLSHNRDEESVQITPLFVVVFVGSMCAMIVLLYFFFDYLVYVIIALFILASILAVYSCFEPFVLWTYSAYPSCPSLTLPTCNLFICVVTVELRQLLLLAASFVMPIVWVIYRKTDWAWILQDILGMLFCINMLKGLRLPSLKVSVILLCLLFVYDIFFVFITPLFTKDGDSIMVEVATGGDAGEELPLVFKMPMLRSDPMKACGIPYSLLGFGDILVPGLFISYCHAYDLIKKTPFRLYWVISMLCYTFGLLVCNVALYTMNVAQPALLYIVPCLAIPVTIAALLRKELKSMWRGVDDDPGQSDQDSPGRNDLVDQGLQQDAVVGVNENIPGAVPPVADNQELPTSLDTKRNIQKEDSQVLLEP